MEDLVAAAYQEGPSTKLFHYTSLEGLMGITESRLLRAGEVRFLNDAQELGYFGYLIRTHCLPRVDLDKGPAHDVYSQLVQWADTRFVDGPYVFAASFTENGDLLSQWRGYCEHGRGLSIGFDSNLIVQFANGSDFRVGKCIYDSGVQQKLASDVVERILAVADKQGPDAKMHASQSYWSLFQQLEPEILTLAALVKNPSFVEESEWRCVSRPVSNYVDAPIRYRPGKQALIPYLELPLPCIYDALAIDTVYIGPSPNQRMLHKTVSSYLAKYAKTGARRTILSSRSSYQG